MEFGPDSRFTTFPIDVLIGLDNIKNVAGSDLSNAKIEMVESLVLVEFGDKVIPFGTDAAKQKDVNSSSSLSRTGKSYVSVSENRPAMASFLDVILNKFFEVERDTLDKRTIQEKVDQYHDEDFHQSYKLEENESEPGVKKC